MDALGRELEVLPISTAVMRRATEFWAQARQGGYPTAADAALDADMILAVQAAALNDVGVETIIATTNVRHLIRFTAASYWRDWPESQGD